MHERTALLAGEHGGVEFLGVFLLGENETGTRTAEGLVRGGRDHVGVRHGARVQARGHESGEVGHIDPEFGADLVGDLLHGLEVLDARVGGPAADDHGRVGFERALADDLRVDAEGLGVHAVRLGVVETAGEVDLHAVGQVAAVVEGQTEHGVAGLDERLVDGGVGLGTGVRLDVGVFGAEQGLGAFAGDGFDLVHVFAAAIVAATGVAFGVFVGQHGALALQYRSRHEVLRGDHLKATALAAQFGVQQFGDLRIGFADRRVESIGCLLRKG